METSVRGVVKEGCIVPSSPLPQGAHVVIRLADPPPEVTDDLRAEFEAWDSASANALELVEHLAQEVKTDEAR